MLQNAALLFKWWWRFSTEEGALWRKVITSIHNEDFAFMPSVALTRVPGTWRDVRSIAREQPPIASTFLKHIKMQLGCGSKIRFWEDRWVHDIQDTTLRSRFPNLYNISVRSAFVIFTLQLPVLPFYVIKSYF